MVVERNTIYEVLLRMKCVSFIGFIKEKTFRGSSYQEVFKCDLAIDKKWVTTIIGIPDNWELSLIDIYLENKDIFIPHLEKNGKLCLYDLEGALIDSNFNGILRQCIERAIDVIQKGIKGKNEVEFLEEFDAYFNMLENLHTGKVVIPKDKKSKIISFSELKKDARQRKGEKQASFIQRKKKLKSTFFASSNTKDFQNWNIKAPQRKGVYIYCEPDFLIFPPDYSKYSPEKFLNQIFENLEKEELRKLIEKCGQDIFITFEIKQNNNITNCFAYFLKKACFTFEEKIKIISAEEFIPITVKRIDKAFLQKRTSFTNNDLENKSYLLIGAGSIGGYVFHNLIKSGCENITVVDNDLITEENIYRHLLGYNYLSEYKAVALSKYAQISMANVNIKTIEEKVENAVIDCGLYFDEYDYIIAATGNHNVNRWINSKIVEDGIQVPVFYIWNEPLDIGSHIALFTYKADSDCFELLFKRDENGELFDITSYCEKGQSFARTYSGCNGTFIPYGSTTSIQSSILFMDVLKMYINKGFSNDVIVSEKGSDFYFKQAGFTVSRRYLEQEDKVSISIIDIGEGRLCPYD